MKKKQENIIIDFTNNNASEDVTGSSVFINYLNTNILLECGLSQGNHSILENYKKNTAKFTFKPKELDYVFAMHGNIDHIGLLPRLYAQGCEAQLIVPYGSKMIYRALLVNSAMISNGECKYLLKKDTEGRLFDPIYTEEDVDLMMNYVREVDVNSEYTLNENIKFKFLNSQHIAFGTSLLLEIRKTNNSTKTIYYTSDLGNIAQKGYYVEDLDKIKKANIVISECTYGSKEKSCSNSDERNKDIQRIESAIEQYSKILVPVFSFHRGQQIATFLYEIFKDKKLEHEIYMDSKLLLEITAIYKRQFQDFKKVMNWSKIHEIDKKSRDAVIHSKEKCIVLASSGMLQGGSSVTYAKEFITKKDNCVIFCGYSSEGSLASKIKDVKQKTITIAGVPCKNRMQVISLRSFSGHIQHDELLSYLLSIESEQVVLHHGNKNTKLEFKTELEEEFSKLCKTTRVVVPSKTTVMRI